MPCGRPACPARIARQWLAWQTGIPAPDRNPALAHEVQNSAAHRLFYRIVGAAPYKVLINLDFNKEEVTKPVERGPLRSEIVWRNGNRAGTEHSCDVFCEHQIAYNVGAIDFNDRSFESCVVWLALTKITDRLRILQKAIGRFLAISTLSGLTRRVTVPSGKQVTCQAAEGKFAAA